MANLDTKFIIKAAYNIILLKIRQKKDTISPKEYKLLCEVASDIREEYIKMAEIDEMALAPVPEALSE